MILGRGRKGVCSPSIFSFKWSRRKHLQLHLRDWFLVQRRKGKGTEEGTTMNKWWLFETIFGIFFFLLLLLLRCCHQFSPEQIVSKSGKSVSELAAGKQFVEVLWKRNCFGAVLKCVYSVKHLVLANICLSIMPEVIFYRIFILWSKIAIKMAMVACYDCWFSNELSKIESGFWNLM